MGKQRGARGDGTIRERPDGRWEARYVAGRDPATGKPIRKSIYGASQNEVRKLLKAKTQEVDDGYVFDAKKITVAQWLGIWANEYIGNVGDSTRRAYRDHVRNHLQPRLGGIPLKDLTAPAIQRAYRELQESGRAKRPDQKKEMPPGLSPKTIKNIHGVLHQALEKAVDLGYIRNNASDAAVLPRIEKKEMQFLQSGETAVFLKACESHHLGALFMVYVLTGVRKSELLGLTWDCVDRESGTLLINKQWKRTSEGLRFTPPKNGKARYVTPPATVFQLLKKQKAAQGELRLKAGAAWNNDNNLVFTNDTGGGRDGDSVYKRYKTFLKNNGLPDLRLHDLRHTSATLMLESGMNYKAVSEQLGHSTPAFTLQQYGHVTAEARRENAQKMEDKLAAIMAAQNL